ncbi:hypothetical protein OURE66S_01619 [Oligella ureolytica]
MHTYTLCHSPEFLRKETDCPTIAQANSQTAFMPLFIGDAANEPLVVRVFRQLVFEGCEPLKALKRRSGSAIPRESVD